MNYVITKSNILIGNIEFYYGINILNSKLIGERIGNRCILFMNHEFYDLETGEQYYQLPIDKKGIIYSYIYSGRKYITKIYKTKHIDDNAILVANELYKQILERKEQEQELIKEKKLAYFKQKRIF